MPSVSFFGHELDLTPGPEKLHGAFDDSIRRGIRKAKREGLKTEISGELAAVRRYYQLHCQTRKRHGMPPQPFKFFANLHEEVLKPGLGCVITAFHRGLPIAAALFVQFGRRAIFKFGASNQRYQHLRGNNLVMWEAVQWFAQRGCASLSFGRTSKANAGLRRFKLGWAAREEEIHYFKYDIRADAFMPEEDRATGWHNRVFRVMPMTVARMIGSILYRRFA
jgi:lipid II:glycine glycyltransferase (peptidoglycan interpeptide bridge formation enzyme)